MQVIDTQTKQELIFENGFYILTTKKINTYKTQEGLSYSVAEVVKTQKFNKQQYIERLKYSGGSVEIENDDFIYLSVKPLKENFNKLRELRNNRKQIKLSLKLESLNFENLKLIASNILKFRTEKRLNAIISLIEELKNYSLKNNNCLIDVDFITSVIESLKLPERTQRELKETLTKFLNKNAVKKEIKKSFRYYTRKNLFSSEQLTGKKFKDIEQDFLTISKCTQQNARSIKRQKTFNIIDAYDLSNFEYKPKKSFINTLLDEIKTI